MYILISDNIITGITGSVEYPGSVFVKKEDFPDGFFDDFEVGKWLYKNGKITINPDYIPPEPPEPSLEEQLAALTEQNQMLTDCILEMSEIVYGGGDT